MVLEADNGTRRIISCVPKAKRGRVPFRPRPNPGVQSWISGQRNTGATSSDTLSCCHSLNRKGRRIRENLADLIEIANRFESFSPLDEIIERSTSIFSVLLSNDDFFQVFPSLTCQEWLEFIEKPEQQQDTILRKLKHKRKSGSM
ncbi:hypothetical protein RF11_11531 [Thelohanellus kitauei]|uniref:Uncharacterized protein n=1 Tax=Thelohanellus kitauei TaxID=669202 RepID=A0A0C2N510_THEKT|nr:hypothetical protein RF11_11531 [Thelohanellus kitauei]